LKLRDDQWERIREHFPEENAPDSRPGRKPIPTRRVLEAALWILNTGAQWHMLPQGYPNYKTVHRRFQQWCREETLRKVLTDLANALREEGEIDESECFLDRQGLPLSVSTYAANHHEVTLVQLSFDFYMIEAKPENLIGDKAYDSDSLDEELRREGIEMIAPHRSGRKRKTQDGRRLRRYQRRWIVERFFAWIQWRRRLLVRWEFYPHNFLGFVQLAAICILLRHF